MTKYFLLFTLLFISSCSTSNKVYKIPNFSYYWELKKSDQTIFVLGTIHMGISSQALPMKILEDLKESELAFIEAKELFALSSKKGAQEATNTYYAGFDSSISNQYQQLSKTAQLNYRHVFNHPSIKPVLNNLRVYFDAEESSFALMQLIFNIVVTQPKFVKSIPPKMLLRLQKAVGKKDQKDFSKISMDLEIAKYIKKYNIKRSALDKASDITLLSEKLAGLVNGKPTPKAHLRIIETIYGDKPSNQKELTKTLSEMNSLIEMYKKGSSKKLLQLVQKSLKEQGISNEEVLISRNKKWAKKVSATREKRIFIAAGVAHFLGEANFIDLMIKNGYQMKKVLF